MLGFVSTPFYIELGFSKQEIASVVKVFGLIATILGAFAGGWVVYRIGLMKGLFQYVV
jgi:PAT family beta-lactamase induction signal transducer AmpG